MWMFSSLFGIWKFGIRVRVWSWFFWGLLFAVFLFVFSSRFVVCCDHDDLGFVESPSPSSLRC